MAALTWRNVAGFSTEAGSEATQTAGNLFNKAFNKAEGIAKTAQTNLEQDNTAIALDNLRQLKTTEDLDNNADQFTNESLTQRFGAGNFDANKVSLAANAARDNIVGKTRAEQKHLDAQSDRQLKLDDEAFARTIKQDNRTRQLDTQRQSDAGNIITSSLQAPSQKLLENENILTGSLSTFDEQNPEFAGQIQVKGGVPVFPESMNPSVKKKYTDIAVAAGYSPPISSTARLRNARNALTENNITNPNVRKTVLDSVKELNNEPNLNETQTKELSGFITAAAVPFQRQLKLAETLNNLELSRIKENIPLSAEENAEAELEFSKFLISAFPDGTFSFGIGNQEGGTDLTTQISGILNTPILIDGVPRKVELWMVKAALSTSADWEDRLFDDSSVDLSKLKDNVRTVLKRDPNKQATDKKEILIRSIAEQEAVIGNALTAETKKITGLYKLSNGIPNVDRNLQLNSFIENADAEVKTFDDSVSKAKKDKVTTSKNALDNFFNDFLK